MDTPTFRETVRWLWCRRRRSRIGPGKTLIFRSPRFSFQRRGASVGFSAPSRFPSDERGVRAPCARRRHRVSIRTAMASAPRHMQGMALAVARITSSRELVAQARARLGDTQILIALSRRWLNPWWGLSGSSDHDTEGALLQSVLDRLQRGVLVPLPPRVGAGRGTRRICSICTQAIYPDEIENEVALNEGGVTVRLWTHTGCLAIWRRASDVYAQQHPSSADGHAE